jgi:hypothetical protein
VQQPSVSEVYCSSLWYLQTMCEPQKQEQVHREVVNCIKYLFDGRVLDPYSFDTDPDPAF